MNICFFTTEYPNERSGGVEKVTYDLRNRLMGNGFRVFIVSLRQPMDDTIALLPDSLCLSYLENVAEVLLRYVDSNKVDLIVNQSEVLQIHELVRMLQVKRNIRAVKVLHTDPACAVKGIRDNEVLFCNGGKLKRFFSWDVNPINYVRKYKRKCYLRLVYREWIKSYDRVVLLSERFIESFCRLSRIAHPQHLLAIPNSVAIQNNDNGAEKENIVLFVGRLVRDAKRPDRAVKIWESVCTQNPDWTFMVLGDGPLREPLMNYCVRKGVRNIQFEGRVNPEPYYKRAKILCCTSTYEGFSLAVCEAMSYGVVPIAFDGFEVIHDLIQPNQTGFLIKPFRMKRYAKKLQNLMRDANLIVSCRKRIQADSKHWEQFSPEVVTRQWEYLFHSVLKD